MPTPTEAIREEVVALYARDCPSLIGLLTSIGGSRDEAEEVAREAYVKMLGQWSKVGSRGDPQTWVRVVAVRLMVSRHRRAEAANFGLSRLAGRAQQHQVEVTTDAVPIAAALRSLPVSQKAVVVLCGVLDLPPEQVAQELQVPVGKVKFHLTGARAALALMLRGTGEPCTSDLKMLLTRHVEAQTPTRPPPPLGGAVRASRRSPRRRPVGMNLGIEPTSRWGSHEGRNLKQGLTG